MRIAIFGDLHGQLGQAKALWTSVQRKVGKDPFRAIFLGDYVDRGPDSRGVIDWLISLRDATESKGQGAGKVGGQAGCCDVTFLAGNHDLAMAMFLGLHPMNASQAAKTWKGDKELNFPPFIPRRREGSLWKGVGAETMHLQGLRWGGSAEAPEKNPFQSSSTFASYGVKHGDRQALLDALPAAHLAFLQALEPWYSLSLGQEHHPYKTLLAIHAGLEIPGKNSMLRVVPDVDQQLEELRDGSALALPWIEQLQGRGNTRATPDELQESQTLLVSGHHGILDLDSDWRWIIDHGSGGRPLAAVLLPDQLVLKALSAERRQRASAPPCQCPRARLFSTGVTGPGNSGCELEIAGSVAASLTFKFQTQAPSQAQLRV